MFLSTRILKYLTNVALLRTIVLKRATEILYMTLADIVLGDYRQRVLVLLLLNPQEHFHLREIARQTGAQVGSLSRELSKLAEAGILLTEQVGNQVHYFANRDCPIFEELASILRKTSDLPDGARYLF